MKKSYTISNEEHGFTITEFVRYNPRIGEEPNNKTWAFTTLKELLEFVPTLYANLPVEDK